MSATLTPAEPQKSTEEDPRLKAYLFNLLEVGQKVLQSVGRQADLQAQPTPEGEPPHPVPPFVIDVADQFERVSRAIRRTVLLVRHIAQARPAHNPARKRTEARKQIIREVEDLIQRNPRHAHRVETLNEEFRERLDSPDLEDEIANRPIADIITDIVRDLDVVAWPGTHPWCRRTPRNIADLNARAALATPPGPYQPGPHGPEPGAAQPKDPPKPPDLEQEYEHLRLMTKIFSGK